VIAAGIIVVISGTLRVALPSPNRRPGDDLNVTGPRFSQAARQDELAQNQPPNIIGNCNNTGPNGSVNCNITNPPNQPEIRGLGELPVTKKDDGTIIRTIMIFVQPATPLVAFACGDDVVSVEISVWTGVMTGSVPQPRKDNCVGSFNENVSGRWGVKINLKSESSNYQLKFQKAF
jgi:hypothetical protein